MLDDVKKKTALPLFFPKKKIIVLNSIYNPRTDLLHKKKLISKTRLLNAIDDFLIY